MRSIFAAIAATTIISACASQTVSPVAPVAAAAPAAAVKSPQCYNGDSGQFVDAGTAASISGIAVKCEKTADGKSAQWMGGAR